MAEPSVISFAPWGLETTFGTESAAVDKVFGAGVRIPTLEARNNVERVFGTGSRNSEKNIPKAFEGDLTTEFILASPWFLRLVMGGASVTGAGPYTHTFDEEDTLPSATVIDNFKTVVPIVRALLGTKVNTCVITAAVNELVRVRLDMFYADEAKDATLHTNVQEAFDCFTFAQGTFELPNGVAIAQVQNAEVTIANNLNRVPALGSRFNQAMVGLNREYSATSSFSLIDDAVLDQFYGSSSGPAAIVADITDMELVFTNGLAGTSERTISLLFSGVQIDTDSMPQDPTAVQFEDINVMMESAVVTAVNNTAVFP